jgi:hypothetical protein
MCRRLRAHASVSFIHRFGDALNEHIHVHCCVIDALFYLDEDTLRISELPGLSEADIASIQTRIAQRVVRWFMRRGYLDGDDGRAMLEWQQDGGFSLDANVRIAADDRAGLEHLIRYCARPPFALERLEAIDEAHLIYHLSKPQPDGVWDLRLTPLELIDRIAALIPPPRIHRHRYHGVLAPNSPLRASVVALAQATASTPQPATASEPPPSQPIPVEPPPAEPKRSPAHSIWAMLLARLFETLPLTCPHCGAEVRIIAFITEAPTVRAILDCVGEPVKPPPITLSPWASILGRYGCAKRRYARTRSTRTRVRVRPGSQLVDNLSVFLPL